MEFIKTNLKDLKEQAQKKIKEFGEDPETVEAIAKATLAAAKSAAYVRRGAARMPMQLRGGPVLRRRRSLDARRGGADIDVRAASRSAT